MKQTGWIQTLQWMLHLVDCWLHSQEGAASCLLSSCAAAARFNGEAAVVASRCCMQAPFAAASCAQIILWIPNRSIPVAPATLPLATFFPTTFRQLHFAAVIALAQPAVPERKSGIKKTPCADKLEPVLLAQYKGTECGQT
jgi:hypothetical protein